MTAALSPPPKIALYGARRVPYTEKCRRALLLKRLEFELHEPSSAEDVRRWSPVTGLLPVMTVDGELISDSTHILLRLDRIRPEPPLVSPEPMTATQQRHLEDWADESFLWYYQQWLRIAGPTAPAPAAKAQPLRHLGRWRRTPKADAPAASALLQELGARMNDLVNLLGARPFFHSDRISMADLTVYGMLSAFAGDAIVGAAALLESRPALLGFMRRVEEQTRG
ncbi:MAG TPA: glutathione S-transferase family protein [Myxococcota bacterium]|nr:glutathione S-transferase family protein [Myxococcota bacterium]